MKSIFCLSIYTWVRERRISALGASTINYLGATNPSFTYCSMYGLPFSPLRYRRGPRQDSRKRDRSWAPLFIYCLSHWTSKSFFATTPLKPLYCALLGFLSRSLLSATEQWGRLASFPSGASQVLNQRSTGNSDLVLRMILVILDHTLPTYLPT